MLDIGWSELLIIGMVGLIVIGPKDLPKMFRALGRFTAKARSMAREFSQAMEDAAKSSGLDDAAGTLRDVKSLTSKKSLGLDALERAADRFEKWDPKLPPRSAASPAAPAAAAAATTTLVSDPGAPTATAAARAAAVPAASPLPEPEAAPAAPRPASTPGQRRLRAVRRTDIAEG